MRILFVCLGNICRSPSAEAVLRAIAAKEAPELRLGDRLSGYSWAITSAAAPDARSQEAARRRGYDMSPLRARIVETADFERFDLVLAMDENNLSVLQQRVPAAYRERVQLFLDFAPDCGMSEVPDPYYGGPAGFEHVLDLVEEASRGLIAHLRARVRAA